MLGANSNQHPREEIINSFLQHNESRLNPNAFTHVHDDLMSFPVPAPSLLLPLPPPSSPAMAMAVEPSTTPSKEEMSASSPAVPKPAVSPDAEIRAVARKFSEEPVQNPDPKVWAVLTAISSNARKRSQGMHILLSADEHCLGRVDNRFQIGPVAAISANHCNIFREKVEAPVGEVDRNSVQVFLKDTSTNGTYLNWEKQRKSSPRARLQHGDIIAFIAPPHDDKSYAFVYREVRKSISLANGAVKKRKSEEFGVESKRVKGIGIGALDGPISLDDVRSLQRSNSELRQQLESHVLTIETLRCEIRESVACHENELKVLKETISNSYLDRTKELQQALDVKQKELDELNTSSAELRNSIEDLNERLCASMQARADADEIITSQKATISDVEAQLDEERNQRRGEREKAEADLKSAIQRAQSEAQAETKRQADVYSRQRREQEEVISKLQESERESRVLVETLRSKVEDARESLVMSEKKVRQLEVQVQDEQIGAANSRKKSETLETELQRSRKELESEKVAREEAWGKVSALELEMAATVRYLSMEKQRLQEARERIILRETQLRSFYSTTEEISLLFAKQQEQLKAMQKTLEDEENYENTSFDSFGVNLNEPAPGNTNLSYSGVREAANRSNSTREASTPKNSHPVDISSGDGDDDDNDSDDSTTEKHECDPRSQDNTQDLECTSVDRFVKGFGLDIDGVGTTVIPDGEPTDTERVLGTESPIGGTGFDERNTLAGDTMQLDVETQAQENMEPYEKPEDRTGRCSQPRMEDTEPGTIRTSDLLASEVAGSWALSTAPSVHGENESPRSMGDAVACGEDVVAAALVLCSEGEGQVAGSQSNVFCGGGGAKMSDEHRALNAMIKIVAPDFRQHFQGGPGGDGEEEEKADSMSSAETEEGSDGGGSDDDDDDDVAEDEAVHDAVEDGNEAMIEDSVG